MKFLNRTKPKTTISYITPRHTKKSQPHAADIPAYPWLFPSYSQQRRRGISLNAQSRYIEWKRMELFGHKKKQNYIMCEKWTKLEIHRVKRSKPNSERYNCVFSVVCKNLYFDKKTWWYIWEDEWTSGREDVGWQREMNE